MSRRVLLVDDEPHVLEVLRVTLEEFSFEMAQAETGPLALSKAKEFNPDVVVLDVMLPEMDGHEVCKQLKAERPDLPVMLLTARSQPEDEEQGLAAGADVYLTKPFSPLTLLSEIHRLLEMDPA